MNILTATALAATLFAAALPAHAQLGSMNNPPPQNLFGSRQTTTQGANTMAERRARLAHMKKTRKPVTR